MRSLGLVLLGQLFTAPILAQSPEILPGTRVKVETPQVRVAGTLMSQTRDSIIVATPGSIRTVFASDAVTRIAVSQGRSRARGALQGMKIGLIVVGGLTAVIIGGALLTGPDSEAESDDATFLALVASGLAVGAVYGGAIGGLIGAERWSTVYSAPIRVSVQPFRGAPGVGVSLSLGWR